ncbi:MAG: hypothetical protein Q8P41_05335 [Pseudomonadota bacterium]|nr:hypothetical protein [Pseudomonadota bacterium]
MRAITPLLVLVAVLATGCGPDCYSSCEKIFGDSSGECDIQIPGKVGESGRQDMISQCVSHCERAMRRNGDVGDYTPNERASGDDDISLENEKQAALWMDCVAETSCDNLNSNYCAPVKNYP